MNELFPGEDQTKIKDLIVSKSPLLRTFTDKMVETDPDMWNRILQSEFISNKSEMFSLIGNKSMNRDLNAYFKMASDSKIFNSEIERGAQIGFILCIAWMGFEIGNENEVDLFVDDILTPLFVFNAVKSDFKTEEFVKEVLRCGVLWKRDINGKTPLVFKNFIGKLKFEE